MIFKSIKWRLQLWYGLILVAVLVGFGATAYQLERNRVFRRVDEEIHHRLNALAQQLHRPHQLHGPPLGPLSGRPPADDRPPPEFPDDNGPPDSNRSHKFNLAPQVASLFDANDPNQFYFLIRGPDGKDIARSTNAPDEVEAVPMAPPYNQTTMVPGLPNDSKLLNHDGELRSAIPDGRQIQADQPVPQMRGSFREITIYLPSGEWILVGRSIKPELAELHLTALKLAGFGGAILFIGFAGGWVFVGRALRPISEISSTAAKISGGDLSQRINTTEAESELGQLAAVLNSTFARLETAFAQQKQFASDAAHELRTPVSVILTQTQTSLARERDAAGYRQTVEACQRAAQRMRRLIESLLELARFDAGQEVLNRLTFDFSQTVDDCVQMIQPLAEERRVKIISELQPLQMAGDSERLAQVVSNLLTNAIQYNRPDGEVRVKLAAQPGLAVLEISDTGKGIAREDMPHVFERFYRADKSRTGGNAGLGLSICKAIVEAHGGDIEVSSAENEGTKLLVRLPAGK
jgi:signal transduction histidine kinase